MCTKDLVVLPVRGCLIAIAIAPNVALSAFVGRDAAPACAFNLLPMYVVRCVLRLGSMYDKMDEQFCSYKTA